MKSISRAMLPLKAVEETPSLPGGSQQSWRSLACKCITAVSTSVIMRHHLLSPCVSLFSHEVFLSYEDVSQKDEGPTLLQCDLTLRPAITLFLNRITF